MKITLCLGSSCHARGNRHRVETLKAQFAARGLSLELTGSLCLGRCAEGPVALVGDSLALGPDDLAEMLADRSPAPL